MPKVSIMVPAYNHGDFIQEALESICNQTFSDYEVIVSDDNSPDNTVDVIRQFDDPRINLHVFEHNVGASRNHEYCWKHCTGRYIALLNSDDVWLPEHLEKSVAYLDANPSCAAVFSWASLIDENSTETDACVEVFRQPNRTHAQWLHHFFVSGNCICHPSMVIRREVYDQVGFYSRTLRQLPDFDQWIRVVKKYDIHILQEVTVQHRRMNQSMGNTSAPILTNSIRDVAESQYILSHFFDGIDDDLFKEAFSSLFRHPEASTHEQLLCERFFLLLDNRYYMKNVSDTLAFSCFQQICQEPGVLQTLESQYNYTTKDFFRFGGEMDILGIGANHRQDKTNAGIYSDIKRLIRKILRTIRTG